jgi:hypothetical protein
MMFIGALGFTAFPAAAMYTISCSTNESTICNDIIIYCNVVVASAFTGLMSALLWVTPFEIKVSQSKMLTDLCNDATRGRYFGTFWSLMQLSQITGNVATLLLLRRFTHFQFVSILSLSSLVPFPP